MFLMAQKCIGEMGKLSMQPLHMKPYFPVVKSSTSSMLLEASHGSFLNMDVPARWLPRKHVVMVILILLNFMY